MLPGSRRTRTACLILCLQLGGAAWAVDESGQETAKTPETAKSAETAVVPDESVGPVADTPDEWIDRAHDGLHAVVWRSAMHVDRWFGGADDEEVYRKKAIGSITPAVFWSEFQGFDQKFRFRVKLPLPYLDERYDAFIGTVNREEFVTEREQQSGAIPRQDSRGQIQEDETLFGVRFRQPRQGGRWEVDAGLRIRSPIDPFVKAGWRYDRGSSKNWLLGLRETVFWQNSEEFGFTSRIDIERAIGEAWLARWTASGTISQETEGVRGYSALTAYRGLPNRQAVAAQVFTSGEFDADVPLGEYGIKFAYRRSVVRDWLVMEIRPSVTWPKSEPEDPRKASWGIGIGFEMFFGIDEFSASPATF
jgi:hypothetical protein